MDAVSTAQDEAIAALEPFGTLPEWLASVMRPERLAASLSEVVPELVDGRLSLVSCATEQLRAKGERWLVRCLVTVSRGESGDPRQVALVGVLHPPGSEAAQPRPGDLSPFGTAGHRVWLPDLGLDLAAEEEDVGLPSLGDLVAPQPSAGILEALLRTGGRDGVRVASSLPTVMRYKPGSRCTIRYDVTYEPTSSDLPSTVFAKTHQGEKGIRAHEAMTALWQSTLAGGGRVVLAEPLGYLPEEHIQLQGPVPEGPILKDLCHEAFETADPVLLAQLRPRLRACAHALAALHSSGVVLPERTGMADEIAAAQETLDELSASIPEVASWARPALALIEAADRAAAADPEVSSHNSFSPAQVLLGPAGPAFIDFDSAAMGEPAMDIGRFCAGLRCVGVPALAKHPDGYHVDRLRARLALMDELCDEFVRDYQARAPVTAERIVVWESLDLLASLLHTWTKGRIEKVAPRLATLRHQLLRLPDPL